MSTFLILTHWFASRPRPHHPDHQQGDGDPAMNSEPTDNLNRTADFAAKSYRQQAAEFRRRATWCDHEAARQERIAAGDFCPPSFPKEATVTTASVAAVEAGLTQLARNFDANQERRDSETEAA